MSFVFRASLLLLALSLNLVNSAPAQSQSSVMDPDKSAPVASTMQESKYDEFANALLAAKTDEERAALLKAQPELAPAEIARALVRRAERLRDEKQYAEALAAAQLALRLAEQANDRAAQGLAWEQIGRPGIGPANLFPGQPLRGAVWRCSRRWRINKWSTACWDAS